MNDNTSTTTQGQQQCRFWKGFTYLGKLLFVGVGALGTLLGIWQWYVSKNSEPHLRFSVLDNQCLTQIEKVPGLDCNLSYAGRRIQSLWVSKIRIENDCRKNIIGLVGGHLMSSNVSFTVSESFHVITVECETDDFAVDASCVKDGFALAFKKWKPQQGCLVRVYCEGLGDANEPNGPSFKTTFEPFTQGDIKIEDHQALLPERSLMKCLPIGMSIVLVWVGIVVNSFIFLVCWWGLLYKMGWVKMFRRLRWNRKYQAQVLAIMKESGTDSTSDSKNIDALPGEFWNNHNIPHPPVRSPLVSGLRLNRSELIPPLVIAGVFLLLSTITLLALISV